MIKNMIFLFIFALLTLESFQSPTPSNSDPLYELRVALWKTRSQSRNHWALQINEENSRNAFQVDIVNDKTNRQEWRPRAEPSSSLDSNALAGSVVVGKITQAQVQQIKMNAVSRYQAILNKEFQDCQHFLVAILDWSSQEGQNIIPRDAYLAWEKRQGKPPMEILQDPALGLDISRSPWGHVSQMDIENKFSDGLIDFQMRTMYTKYVQVNDWKGLQAYLQANEIVKGGDIPVDAWTTVIKKYTEDAMKQINSVPQPDPQRKPVDPLSDIEGIEATAAKGGGRSQDTSNPEQGHDTSPLVGLDAGRPRGQPRPVRYDRPPLGRRLIRLPIIPIAV